MNVSILGAGAAGLFSALEILKKQAIELHLFDLNPNPGRKLSITGSGRGNLTNLNQFDAAYRSSTCANVRRTFQLFNPQSLCEVFDQLGIPTLATDDGWVYPISNAAANVAHTLAQHVQAHGAIVHSGVKITRIFYGSDRKFTLQSDDGERFDKADALLVASGSCASPQVGANDAILSELRKMGIEVIPFKPALTGLISSKPIKALSGLRLDVCARLYVEGTEASKEVGNLIFTDFGVNGPAAMNLSHLIHAPSSQGKNVELSIDFLTESRAETVWALFHAQTLRDLPVRCLWNALFPEKLTFFLLQRMKLPPDSLIGSISPQQFKQALKLANGLRLPIVSTKSFQDAQAGFGGVGLDQINPQTMESNHIPGLYFAGEVLDCIGKCGGYNLHWAWSSAALAARAILEKAVPQESYNP